MVDDEVVGRGVRREALHRHLLRLPSVPFPPNFAMRRLERRRCGWATERVAQVGKRKSDPRGRKGRKTRRAQQPRPTSQMAPPEKTEAPTPPSGMMTRTEERHSEWEAEAAGGRSPVSLLAVAVRLGSWFCRCCQRCRGRCRRWWGYRCGGWRSAKWWYDGCVPRRWTAEEPSSVGRK